MLSILSVNFFNAYQARITLRNSGAIDVNQRFLVSKSNFCYYLKNIRSYGSWEEDVTWNKKSHIKMFKTALFDCAINEKCCSVDGGRGICPLFSSPPRGIWRLKSPHHPREFAIQGKKMQMPGGQPGWGWGGEGLGAASYSLEIEVGSYNNDNACLISSFFLIAHWTFFIFLRYSLLYLQPIFRRKKKFSLFCVQILFRRFLVRILIGRSPFCQTSPIMLSSSISS